MAPPHNSFALRNYLAQQTRPPVAAQVAQYPTINNPVVETTSRRELVTQGRRAAGSAGRQSFLRSLAGGG